MSERPTPETDVLAEKLTPLACGVTIHNAAQRLTEIVTALLIHASTLERERDEVMDELAMINQQMASFESKLNER